MMIPVLVARPTAEKDLAKLQEISPNFDVQPSSKDQAIFREQLARVEILYIDHLEFAPEDAPRLRWIQLPTAGAEYALGSSPMRAGIQIATVKGAYSVPVAEWTFASLMALTRNVPQFVRLQDQHRWPTDSLPPTGDDLYGKTMGIVGYGSVGRQIARLARCFGMKVLACKRNPDSRFDPCYCVPGTGDPEGTIPEIWVGTDDLTAILRKSDVAVITLPSTPQTRGLIGISELESLPSHAYLVSVGRGGVVDENALSHILKLRRIAGAALDVFSQEPLPHDSPLWSLPNILISPHIASWTATQSSRALKVFAENMRREATGRPLINIIDPDLGY